MKFLRRIFDFVEENESFEFVKTNVFTDTSKDLCGTMRNNWWSSPLFGPKHAKWKQKNLPVTKSHCDIHRRQLNPFTCYNASRSGFLNTYNYNKYYPTIINSKNTFQILLLLKIKNNLILNKNFQSLFFLSLGIRS